MRKKKAVSTKPVLDPANGVCSLNIKGQEITMTMVGLDVPILYRLAMVGAIQLISKRANPSQAWSLIQEGIFGRDTRGRRLPLAIRALALIRKIPESEALKLWRSLSKDDRKKVKRDAAVRAVCSTIRGQKLAEQADSEPLKWLK